MPSTTAAHLSCSWGYDVNVELFVSKRNWNKVIKGQAVTIRGRGYNYEGDFLWDYWDFSGGLDGELMVRYGSQKTGDFSGQGFIGSPRDALVDRDQNGIAP